ncbi:caspase family protein [Saccharothrix carnea]|uniref:caspase family protein n=1 Tax=Saccharothrix carnea TaxID=1280637 RepID=UPI0015E6D6AF|nr:caspase family protein [Saccharothrix carnea]
MDRNQGGGARRALVVASEVGGLSGCENDADAMASLLRANRFDVVRLGGATATRAGILAAYDRLVRDSRPGDAAVVFFAGHGGLVPGEPELRFIQPTDIDDSTEDDFRGVLAEELSVLQWRLSLRTANVTTILDCCFSGRMSRDWPSAGLKARARDGKWPPGGIEARRRAAAEEFRRLRAAHPRAEWYDANPHAVRVLACGQGQLAHERRSPRFGRVHGLLTAALVAELTDAPDRTWQDVADRVRLGVLNLNPSQRPEVEGPVDRVVFTEDTDAVVPTLPVSVDLLTGQARVDGAFLHGLDSGDELLLVPVERGAERLRAKVGVVSGGSAYLTVEGDAAVPEGVIARRVGPRRSKQVVRVDSRSGPPPVDLVAALAEVAEVSPDGGTTGLLATVVVAEGRYRLDDAEGRALHADWRPLDGLGLGRLRREVGHLVTAARLRDLSLRADEDGFDAPVELAVTVVGGRPWSPEDPVVHVGERLRIRVRNDAESGKPVYANVVDLGVGGRVTILNSAEPAGVELFAGTGRPLGADPGGHEPGLPLTWPRGLPAGSARFETVLAVFSDSPQDLRGLTQDGVGHRGRPRSASEELAELLRPGRRDLGGGDPAAVRFVIRNLTFLLCPGGDACAH